MESSRRSGFSGSEKVLNVKLLRDHNGFEGRERETEKVRFESGARLKASA